MCFRLMNRFWQSKIPSSEEYPPAIVGGQGAQVMGRGRWGVGEASEEGWGREEPGGGGRREMC